MDSAALPSEHLRTPATVQAYLRQHGLPGEVVRFSQPTPTVEAAAQAAGVPPEHILKTLLFFVRLAEGEQPYLVLATGPQRVDRRVLARFFGVGRKRVRLATPAEVLDWTGYPVGAVPPLAHRRPIPALMDRRVLALAEVWAGGGAEDALLRIAPAVLQQVLQPQIVELNPAGGSA